MIRTVSLLCAGVTALITSGPGRRRGNLRMPTGKATLAAGAAALTTAFVTAAPAHADQFTICPSGMTGVVTEDTSCAFADNVRYSWYAQPGTIITAFSPKTGQTYTMQCTNTMTDVWRNAKRCVGVNDSGYGLIVIIS